MKHTLLQKVARALGLGKSETHPHVKMSAEELKFRQGAMWKPESSVSKEPLHTETTGGFSSNNGPVPFEPFNEGGTQYPWRLVKSTKHKVMYFLKANYPNAYTGREIARATGLNTSQIGGALQHCGNHVKKVGEHVGSKGCVGFKWQGVLKDRV